MSIQINQLSTKPTPKFDPDIKIESLREKYKLNDQMSMELSDLYETMPNDFTNVIPKSH